MVYAVANKMAAEDRGLKRKGIAPGSMKVEH